VLFDKTMSFCKKSANLNWTNIILRNLGSGLGSAGFTKNFISLKETCRTIGQSFKKIDVWVGQGYSNVQASILMQICDNTV
jgi:hypothetical protein